MNAGTKIAITTVIVVVIIGGSYAAITLASSSRAVSTTTTTTATSISASTSISTSTSTPASTSTSTSTPANNSIGVVNIGYFANINHAQAVIGLANGDYQKAVGPSTQIKTFLFNAGPTEMTALLAGKLDIAYVGPSPAVNAYIQSNGTGLVILAGVTNGGAAFVVRGDESISTVKDLGGKTFAAPQAGNTQDVALRHYLQTNGYRTADNGGNVTIVDTSNSNIVTLFSTKKIDGAWVPEPWAETLILQSGGKLFLDERTLWPNGFSTTELVARTQFLQQHPDVVREIMAAHVAETIWINNHLTQAAAEFNQQFAVLTGQALNSTILADSLQRLAFTYDPLSASVTRQAQNAYSLGFLTTAPTDLSGLYDLSVLNTVLEGQGLPPIH
jgi:NitT/TauT family transport system substrate-binding protein